MKKKPPRAGIYAAEQALVVRRDWEEKAVPRGRLFFWPVIAIGIVGIVWLRPSAWGVLFGFLIGAGIVGHAFLLEGAPDAAYHWERGSEGERRTESRLQPLEEEGWFVFHDIQRPGHNWDHVVVGPAGVFLLETKDRKGELQLVDSFPQVLIDGKVLDEPKIRQWPSNVRAAAFSLFKKLRKPRAPGSSWTVYSCFGDPFRLGLSRETGLPTFTVTSWPVGFGQDQRG